MRGRGHETSERACPAREICLPAVRFAANGIVPRLLALIVIASAAVEARPSAAVAAEPVPAAAAALPRVAPPTPWLPLPPSSTTLTRIGVGSCLRQREPQPIWASVIAARPQVFLMIGDNVYGDTKKAGLRALVDAYTVQGRHPQFATARAALAFMAVWDDHDYGDNDAYGDFALAAPSTALFHDFWQTRRQRERGIHHVETFGPPGRRVQVVMLDTRSFRSAFTRKGKATYTPDPDPAKTLLGDEQWAWLEATLRQPAEIRLIVSSIQVLAKGHAFERWGNLPAERKRLMSTIQRTGARGVILLSGDRHMGAFYRGKTPAGRMLPEMTTSSLNRSHGPSKDARVPPLVGEPYRQENFGIVEIDWSERTVNLELRDLAGQTVGELPVRFADLGIE